MSAVRELAAGLWRIRLPLHFELNHVNVHVLRIDSGFLLVDCGYGTDESFEALESGLRETGVAWSDIREILITHCHPDHAGNAERVRERTGAPVVMHETENAYLPHFRRLVAEPGLLDPWLLSWGAPPEAVDRIRDSFADMTGTYRPAEAGRVLRGGDTLHGWAVIATPGHAPGHVCLHDAARGLLISGDHVLEAISPNIAWLAHRDALADYLASLERVALLSADRVYPSHGDPFGGLQARCRALAGHHDLRCNNILNALAAGGETAQQIVERLWRRMLSPFQHRFALFEVMAHLAYLENSGRTTCDRSAEVHRWIRTPA